MYREIFQNNYPFLNFLQWVAIPLPRHFLDAAAFVIETDLKRLLAGDGMDLERLDQGIKDAQRFGLSLDFAGLGYEAAEWVNRRLTAFGADPGNIVALVNVKEALERLHTLPMGLNLWKAQNVVFDLTKTQYPEKREVAARNGAEAAQWVEMFTATAKALSVKMPA